VDIIAGASLARRAVNLPLSVLKPGCGSRALYGSKLRSGIKNARPKSRNRKFESISLQGRVRCEPCSDCVKSRIERIPVRRMTR
jgi:hypothetical protein